MPTLKVENIRKVANAIAFHTRRGKGLDDRVGFNMEGWFGFNGKFDDRLDSCGTTACIAGWAVLVKAATPDRRDRVLGKYRQSDYTNYADHGAESPSEVARKYLGLTKDQAYVLFIPLTRVERNRITPVQAVRVLRHLARTGEVNWSRKVRGPRK